MKSSLLPLLAGSLVLWAGAAQAADLNVTVDGVRNPNGTVVACLWSSGWGFPDCEGQRDNVTVMRMPAQPGSVSFTFPGIAPGKYALSVAHDQNNDGKLERHRFLKYPLEGAGVSNYLTPPKFAPFHHEAQFTVSEPGASITVPLHYPPE